MFNLTIGDNVSIVTVDTEYALAKIVGIDANQTLAVKSMQSKDSTKGRAMWQGGEIEDVIDHIKQHEIVRIQKIV